MPARTPVTDISSAAFTCHKSNLIFGLSAMTVHGIETCSKEIRINKKQSICSVMRIARAASVTELCLSHGKCENLLQNRPHVSVDMTTWKGIQHTIQNILWNNKKWLYVSSMTSWVMPGNARRHHDDVFVKLIWTCGPATNYISCNELTAAKTKKPSQTAWPAMWYASHAWFNWIVNLFLLIQV